jgi:hypothetical protein
VLYVLLLSLLTGLGLNVVFASHLISAVSVLAATWVLLLMVWDRVELAFVVALPLAFVVCFAVLHFVLFPVTWERFFVGPYLLGAVALSSMVSGGTSRLTTAVRPRPE